MHLNFDRFIETYIVATMCPLGRGNRFSPVFPYDTRPLNRVDRCGSKVKRDAMKYAIAHLSILR